MKRVIFAFIIGFLFVGCENEYRGHLPTIRESFPDFNYSSRADNVEYSIVHRYNNETEFIEARDYMMEKEDHILYLCDKLELYFSCYNPLYSSGDYSMLTGGKFVVADIGRIPYKLLGFREGHIIDFHIVRYLKYGTREHNTPTTNIFGGQIVSFEMVKTYSNNTMIEAAVNEYMEELKRLNFIYFRDDKFPNVESHYYIKWDNEYFYTFLYQPDKVVVQWDIELLTPMYKRLFNNEYYGFCGFYGADCMFIIR